jgi:hypothetical protein
MGSSSESASELPGEHHGGCDCGGDGDVLLADENVHESDRDHHGNVRQSDHCGHGNVRVRGCDDHGSVHVRGRDDHGSVHVRGCDDHGNVRVRGHGGHGNADAAPFDSDPFALLC